jgi:hypothetical protein
LREATRQCRGSSTDRYAVAQDDRRHAPAVGRRASIRPGHLRSFII